MDIKVLVVDDNEDINNAVTETLKISGFSVSQAFGGVHALTMYHEILPHIIVLDLRLPDIDGLYVIEKLKEIGFEPSNIIMITGFGTDEIAEKAYSEGISVFLKKPFHMFEINGVVSSLSSSIIKHNQLQNEINKRRKIEWKFDKLISFSIFGVILVNEEMDIELWNKGAERIFGYLEKEVIGKSLELFVKFGDRMIDSFISQKDRFFEVDTVNKIGKPISLEINFSIEVIDNRSSLVIFIKDISEQKALEKLQDESMKQKERLKQLETFKATMVTLNHNLKQPIYSLLSTVQLLKTIKGEESEDQKFLKRIYSSTKIISSTIDKIGGVKDLKFKDYAGKHKMLDLEESNNGRIQDN